MVCFDLIHELRRLEREKQLLEGQAETLRLCVEVRQQLEALEARYKRVRLPGKPP